MSEEKVHLLEQQNDQINEDSSPSSSSVSLTMTPLRPTYGTLPPSPQIPPQDRITYTWHDLNVYAPSPSSAVPPKHLLRDLTGAAHPGELLAILGSSGAGKTTLLNALTFHHAGPVTGARRANGAPLAARALTALSAYVQQDDLFIGALTVREHLVFQALLRMDAHLSRSTRMRRVDDVIAELALTKCAHTPVGVLGRVKGVSGGERKRLAFAAEVLTNPRLMFCDEPTSGLDSFMALSVVQVLKALAGNGRTVVCTIHQPSSELYAMFDKLLLMSEGRTAFLGSPDEASHFFKRLEAPCPINYNPADYFIQLLAIVPEKERACRQAVNLICDKFERSEIGVRVALEAANILISLILGAIYYGQELNQNGVMNINGVLFIFLTNMTFQNVFAVVNVFCSEMQIFLRENRNGMYRTDVYFLCKTLAELPIFIFLPIVFTAICYFLIGLNAAGAKFYITCGIVALVANVATSFGYLISCASTNVSMALSIGPPLIIPFLLFGGFFLNISSIPVYFQWMSYLSWFRFGNEALMINQWDNIERIDCPGRNDTCLKSGHVVLEIYSFSESHFITDLLALLALIVGFRLLAFFALLAKTYRYK